MPTPKLRRRHGLYRIFPRRQNEFYRNDLGNGENNIWKDDYRFDLEPAEELGEECDGGVGITFEIKKKGGPTAHPL